MYPHLDEGCLVWLCKRRWLKRLNRLSGSRAYVVIEPRAITLATEAADSSARNVLRGHILHLCEPTLRWSSCG